MELITKIRRNTGSSTADPCEEIGSLQPCSSSLINEYVPYFSLFFGTFMKLRGLRYNLYYFPHDENIRYNSSNRLSSFMTALKDNVFPLEFRKSNKAYLTGKQYIYDYDENGNVVILYMLVVKREYMYSINFDRPDPTQFLLLINNKFEQDKPRRLMYNMVKRTIITPMQDFGIDVVYTNNIENWCFRDIKLSFEFPTIAQMNDYFTNLTREVINGITGTGRTREGQEPTAPPRPYSGSSTIRGTTDSGTFINIGESTGGTWSTTATHVFTAGEAGSVLSPGSVYFTAAYDPISGGAEVAELIERDTRDILEGDTESEGEYDEDEYNESLEDDETSDEDELEGEPESEQGDEY